MTEEDIKTINSSLKKVGDDLKAFAEQSAKEIKRTGDMHAETKASVDELLVKQGELNARLQAAEQAVAGIDTKGKPAAPMTMGRMVAESEEFLNFRGKGSFSVGVQAAVDSGATSAGVLIEPQRLQGIIADPDQRLFIRDLLNWGRTASNSLEYVVESGFTNNADVVSENPENNKPESTLSFELESAPIATIAHWVHASKQVLSDAPMLQSYIDGRLRYGLKLKEEAQLLKGSGVGLNINGIYTQASAYSQPVGVSVESETMIDRLRLALLQAELAEYSPDAIILNPIDWTSIELIKDGDKRYLFASPQGLASRGMWARPVVPTQSMDAGDFLVGAFAQGAQGWDREDVTVTVSLEDRDNFVKNMVTILCEERVGLTVYRPEAFIKGDFDGLPVT